MTEYWKSQQNMYFCEYCKVWNKDDPRARAVHEGGAKHKLEVAKRMRTMTMNIDKEKKEKELAAKAIGNIEALARRQYEKDLEQGLGAADKVSTYAEPIGPSIPSVSNTPEGPGKPEVTDEATWVLDKATGYYYNARCGYYFHKDSAQYYGGEPVAWCKELPAHLRHLAFEQGPRARVVSAKDVVQEKTVVRTEIKAHPLSGVGGMTMSTVQGGTIGGTRGLAGASTSAAAASGLLKSIPGPKPLSAPAKAAGAAVGQKRKAMEESMDPEKLARLKKEEAEALARREAAKARLNQRQASFFGMGKTT